jgi:THO complex subunit 4
MDILEQGSAEVIFTRRSEALAALKRYNNVRLDGKAMKIEVIGADLGLSAAATPRISVVPGARGRGQREVVMMYGSSLVAYGLKEAFACWIHQA